MDQVAYKAVYTPAEAAALCRMSGEDFQSKLRAGDVGFFGIPGGHLRFRQPVLASYLERLRIPLPGTWTGAPRNFRVLLVEDDPDLLEIISELLRDEPRIDVRAEDSGFTAGLQIAGWHPDLILLDFLMPGMSGFDLCRRLRSRPDTADIPVLAVTSLTSVEDRKVISECGASDFLGKPFHSETLLLKVRQLLGIEDSASLSA